MARARLIFRERDITAAIRAIEKAGHKVARVSIAPDGNIDVFIGQPDNDEQPETPLDKWLRKHANETEGDQ